MDIMMMIGTFIFSVDTASYQQFSRATEYRWRSQERVNAIEALQFIGEGSDVVTFVGTIYTEYKGGVGQLTVMRGIAGNGKPLVLIDGRGFVHGLWVIEKVEENVEAFFGQGVPRRQRFTMQIRKYGDNKAILKNGIVESVIGRSLP
ncbi:MAG: phage tail protein [Candidatus Margulisiibacteriota bacterium]